MPSIIRPHRSGLLLAVGAYVLWGVLPLYLRLLNSVPPLQILAHRVLWSLLLLALVVLVLSAGPAVLRAARGRTLLLLIGSAALIAVNWLVYIWAVQNHHVLEASLGYFINPLVNVALGMLVLGERLRPLQKAAVAVAGAGVALMASGGGMLWISTTLALSFGFYGLLRKIAAIDALGGLTVETLLLAPACSGLLLYAHANGNGAFGESTRLDLLLIVAGAVTAAPLLMFAAAARKLTYSTLGLLQYIAPTLQFMEAVTFFGEPVGTTRIVVFVLIWIGCALFAWDSAMSHRASSAATPAPTAE
ncbi:chloramphenicol-sensitive protein RarD [Sphingomonas guangdongensis]|uniref:Chloramphenicol-sensitive protein RarD n=1 Tax=Sphingomonas guangdongensis TaxID=1141890 RepID=A0A285QGX2_9SPHN|nr:EamA family transporter RarD [Sphingomonas guangdongensis]SOB80714.1 chloramphenicol-sensitive protein RarD [Sphingomonas guangdongensis]